MLRQIDDWEQGTIGLRRLVEALYGLLEASEGGGVHLLELQRTGKLAEPADELYLRWTELDMELELRTEPWAPAGSSSDERLSTAIASIREHIQRVLGDSPSSNWRTTC
jgi:hypothetical protein